MIDFILHLDTHLLELIATYGNFIYLILFAIVFIETGIVIMPFLPGDSLLFIAGTLSAKGALNPWYLFFLLTFAAIAGDTLNYWIGHSSGKKVFERYIDQRHLRATEQFFQRHGKKTIVLARFVPIVRTFAPFVAGVGKMHYPIFLFYNIIGAICWVGIFLVAGYLFGNIPFVHDNLTAITLGIILLSLLPAIWEFYKHHSTKNKEGDHRP